MSAVNKKRQGRGANKTTFFDRVGKAQDGQQYAIPDDADRHAEKLFEQSLGMNAADQGKSDRGEGESDHLR